MPSYEFECPNGHRQEVVQKMSDPTPATVDCCEYDAARVWSPPAAVHFNGPGFYSTDVKARQERKRRPNAADDLTRHHDQAAANIARSL